MFDNPKKALDRMQRELLAEGDEEDFSEEQAFEDDDLMDVLEMFHREEEPVYRNYANGYGAPEEPDFQEDLEEAYAEEYEEEYEEAYEEAWEEQEEEALPPEPPVRKVRREKGLRGLLLLTLLELLAIFLLMGWWMLWLM